MTRRSNPRRPPKQWMRDCVAGASESAADPGAVCGALWYRKMSPSAKRAALAREGRAENSPALTRNQRLCEALHGYEIGGKLLYYEYPDLLMWAGAGKWSVYATPDYDRRGTISVEASTEDGDSVGGPELRYKAPLTAEQYLQLVRRYVETDPRQWARADNPTRAEHYRAASQAAVKAEKVIAAARKARGPERGRLLDEAEALVRESVEHGRAAGDTWMSYETSSGREEIEKLRGRRANPAWAKVFG